MLPNVSLQAGPHLHTGSLRGKRRAGLDVERRSRSSGRARTLQHCDPRVDFLRLHELHPAEWKAYHSRDPESHGLSCKELPAVFNELGLKAPHPPRSDTGDYCISFRELVWLTKRRPPAPDALCRSESVPELSARCPKKTRVHRALDAALEYAAHTAATLDVEDDEDSDLENIKAKASEALRLALTAPSDVLDFEQLERVKTKACDAVRLALLKSSKDSGGDALEGAEANEDDVESDLENLKARAFDALEVALTAVSDKLDADELERVRIKAGDALRLALFTIIEDPAEDALEGAKANEDDA
eukprot:gnl/TRDRNA2_/TRDRNA2_59349_c0_seq1.p1 gnl/TRDRNA2_/TRDRNA2_59349_c0~~gnl/TRDRNA2_/TRDRNA2_59349_c0_seq1.p1  ORF type:complete len:302 (+),score=72.39 gnl/TRDRNA2_/TRDRNA2_59349_c0_seq1:82-987(+)